MPTSFKRKLLSQNFVYSYLVFLIRVDLFFQSILLSFWICYIHLLGLKDTNYINFLALSPLTDPRDCQFLFNLCFQNWNPVHLSKQFSNRNRLTFIRNLNISLKNIPLIKYLWNQFEVSSSKKTEIMSVTNQHFRELKYKPSLSWQMIETFCLKVSPNISFLCLIIVHSKWFLAYKEMRPCV